MSRHRWWFVAAAVLAAVGVAFVPRAVAPGCDQPEAAETAAAFARDLLTYDADTVEDQVARVLDYGDERFVEEYGAAAGPEFVERVRSNGTRAEARLLSGPTLDGCEEGRPAYGVLVSQVVQRDTDDAPRVLRTPLRLTMVDDAGTWRVHQVDIL